jgi:hypothetical protein
MTVAAFEKITVPAGNFLTARIEVYDRESGRLDAEYWYSPAAKWNVKIIHYAGGKRFTRERDLQSFKIDG